jgi:hypothetical protein
MGLAGEGGRMSTDACANYYPYLALYWAICVAFFGLAGAWLAFVGWLRVSFLREQRLRKSEAGKRVGPAVPNLGASSQDGRAVDIDRDEAFNEAMDRAVRDIKKQMGDWG